MSSLNPMSSFRDYTYNLRQSFRVASKNELGTLGALIQDIGYNWLDDYVAGCEARCVSKAPITQLIKTPSRTATVRKTRVAAAAGQERANKLKALNAQASPSSKTSNNVRIFQMRRADTDKQTRLPLSPLGARAANIASPNLEVPSPKHAKTSPIKKAAKGGKGKGKKAKGKKGEVAMTSPIRPPPEDVVMDEPPEEPEEPIENTVKSPRSKGGLTRTVDLSYALSPKGSSSNKRKESPTELRNPPSGPTAAPIAEHLPTKDVDQVAESSTAATQKSAPSQPHRQVRSSWLSKALGAGPGVRPSDANLQPLRKSIMPSQKMATEYEYPSNRRSLAPVGGLKRKSEVADDPIRPEKVSKVEEYFKSPPPIIAPLPVSSALTRPPFDRQISREGNPSTRESIFPSRPAVLAQTVPAPVVPDAANQDRVIRPAAVEKVNRALDEFREAQLAKEQAAKAKAAAAVRPAAIAPSTNTGAGFLRGLGNIGAGLGRSLGLASSRHANGDVARVQELEDEEERRRASMEAKEQLAMILQKSPDKVQEATSKATKSAKSTARVMSPPTTAALAGLAHAIDDAMDDEELEDSRDEMKVLDDLDDLHPVDPDIPQSTAVPSKSHRAYPVHSPPRAPRQDVVSTTPMGTPPRPISPKGVPPLHGRNEKHMRSSPSRPPKTAPIVPAAQPPKEMLLVKHDSDLSIASGSQPSKSSRSAPGPIPTEAAPVDSRPPSVADHDTEDEELEEEEEVTARYQVAGKPLAKSASQQSLALSTTSSTSMFSTAATIAGKVLGVRPQPGNVKSLQLAAAAQKKEQLAASDRKALREAAEKRKQELADKKAESDRIKAEEERRLKIADLEEKRRIRAEQEKIRKENEEKKAANARAKAAREEREKEKELAAARAKAEEEAKKRKLAQAALNKSTANNAIKRIGPGAIPASSSSASLVAAPPKPPQTIKLVSSSATLTATSSTATAVVAGGSKLGPGVFRTDNANVLVTPQQAVPAPRALGPPARPSAMAMSSQAQAIRNSVAVTQATIQGPHGAILQQSRVALQSQLDEKVAEVQSEDIVLPDIASEYSDSDDEDRTRDFERPQWAESPELRAALEQQATRDPDELFGPIHPLNMEELFKARANKFRARSSSANWHKGDGLTRAEEIEYARRMGFKPSNLGQ